MSNQPQLFQHEEFGNIRAFDIEGQPWFVGKDVAEALGYANSGKAVMVHVDDDDKMMEMIPHSQNGKMVTKTAIINESGLYSLILSSKLPAAKKFKRWVTSEILPSIRKHKAYIDEAVLKKILESTDYAAELASRLMAEKQKTAALSEKTAALTEYVGTLTPKVRYCDAILQCPEAIQVSIIAKDYGMSATAFNRLLHGLGVQYRMGRIWLLYQQFSGRGYTKSRTYYASEYTCTVQTYWTQRGRFFLYDLFKDSGLLPVVEREEWACPLC